jgi:hypothetical protein
MDAAQAERIEALLSEANELKREASRLLFFKLRI